MPPGFLDEWTGENKHKIRVHEASQINSNVKPSIQAFRNMLKSKHTMDLYEKRLWSSISFIADIGTTTLGGPFNRLFFVEELVTEDRLTETVTLLFSSPGFPFFKGTFESSFVVGDVTFENIMGVLSFALASFGNVKLYSELDDDKESRGVVKFGSLP